MEMDLEPWAAELGALYGCFVSFLVMVALLAVYDGHPVFEWNSVTLNALISVFAVAMKAFLMLVVADCVGQWKWILFSQNGRKLMDFERIDRASRGMLGSFDILWRKETP